jgi:hypothetical protein
MKLTKIILLARKIYDFSSADKHIVFVAPKFINFESLQKYLIFVHGKISNFSGYETTFRKHVNFVFHGHKTEGLQNL